MKILLVEPKYRSKFPPLGLMRISTFHKKRGDSVQFIRGTVNEIKHLQWDRIYISSLFTYDLPKTVETINYYSDSVKNPEEEIIVGGIGATLIPEFIQENSICKVLTGPLDTPNRLGLDEEPIADLMPDYDMISSIEYNYKPEDAYFARVSIGCIRKCKFCAVPVLESHFGFLQGISEQVDEVISKFGEKKDLIILDNNILALPNIIQVLKEIKDLGFERGAKFNRKLRFVDFNQGIDSRLINKELAKELGKINVRPIRLAFDDMSYEKHYRKAIDLLQGQGFRYFTTYVMYNFNDSPREFYERLRINIDLSKKYDIKITSFPMKFVPIDNTNRYHISKKWNWKFLRGIQCILNATHGMVSPLEDFFNLAFGKTYKDFMQIVSMPDNYIIYRKKFETQAEIWKETFSKLNVDELNDVYKIFDNHHHNAFKIETKNAKIDKLLNFYKCRGLEFLD